MIGGIAGGAVIWETAFDEVLQATPKATRLKSAMWGVHVQRMIGSR